MTHHGLDLYLTELTVADLATALAWYRDRLGLTVELLDAHHGYALLNGGSGRIALKVGQPVPGGIKLVFRVADLDATLTRLAERGLTPTGPVRTSDEGYRSARFRDPDGHGVEVFAWG